MKKVMGLIMIACAIMLSGCETPADRVSYNVSQQAENFNVIRRLAVINVRTDEPVFELVSAFSLEHSERNGTHQLEIICQTGEDEYKKHFVGLTEWTVYVVEDLYGPDVSKFHYEVNFLPEMLLPIVPIREADGTYAEES